MSGSLLGSAKSRRPRIPTRSISLAAGELGSRRSLSSKPGSRATSKSNPSSSLRSNGCFFSLEFPVTKCYQLIASVRHRLHGKFGRSGEIGDGGDRGGEIGGEIGGRSGGRSGTGSCEAIELPAGQNLSRGGAGRMRWSAERASIRVSRQLWRVSPTLWRACRGSFQPLAGGLAGAFRSPLTPTRGPAQTGAAG